MWTPLGPTQSVLIRGLSCNSGGYLIHVKYVWDHMQCPHYSGCPHFRSVCKAGFHCIYLLQKHNGKKEKLRLVYICYIAHFTELIEYATHVGLSCIGFLPLPWFCSRGYVYIVFPACSHTFYFTGTSLHELIFYINFVTPMEPAKSFTHSSSIS